MAVDAPARAGHWTIAGLLADVIADELADVDDGHCVRVNHFDEALARVIIAELADRELPKLNVHLLGASRRADDPLIVSADQAIELRNRKGGVLCLFVPAGAHDSAASSLGNSFSSLDGPALIRMAHESFRARNGTNAAARLADAVQRQTTSRFRPTQTELLDLALAAQNRAERGEANQIGLELWRAGLIPDAGPDFENRLRLNRAAVSELARPARVSSGLDERVGKLKLEPATAHAVANHLRGKNLQNARAWTQSFAAAPGGSFDHWRQIDNEPVDCDSVAFTPLLDPHGFLNPKATGLVQEVQNGEIFAPVGEKKKLKLSWTTAPKNTTVPKWLLELVPADDRGDDESIVDLPSLERKGSQKTASLPLDIDLGDGDDATRDLHVRVKITAISEDGQPLFNHAKEAIVGYSDDFYLTGQEFILTDAGPTPRDLKRFSSTLAEGVLKAVVTAKASVEGMSAPDWKPAEQTTTFTMRATNRETIYVVFSALLDGLQARTLAGDDPLGIWSLTIDGAAPSLDHIAESSGAESGSDEERRFIQARRSLFKLVSDQPKRHRVEVADWEDEKFQRAAIAHARAWVRWLDAANGHELRRARSVDTLRVQSSSHAAEQIDALIVLPTHPLRTLWLAAHGALLGHWARRLEETEAPKRKQRVQLELVSTLAAVNAPAFAHHPDVAEPYVFFRNLDAGHGVAFSAAAEDPALKLAGLAKLFGLPGAPSSADGEQEERAADTIDRFRLAHPYADPFRVALVNPDDGTFAGNAIGAWSAIRERERRAQFNVEDDAEPLDFPRLTVTAYVDDRRRSLRGLDDQRRRSEESATTEPSDHLQPALSVVVKDERRLSAGELSGDDQHHLAILQDQSRPKPHAIPAPANAGEYTSLALHGLVARYVSTLSLADGRHTWSYWIEPNAPAMQHPVDKGLSDGLAETHRAASQATARLLGAAGDARAGLHAALSPSDIARLDRIHDASDWVLTVDRFIGADLFDATDADLEDSGRPKYILDAAPSFQDGFGHRSLVTTSSRAEINQILAKALREFGFPGEQVDQLIQALKVASGRLVLDALRRETRAREVVALAIAIAALLNENRLKDTLIVPVDIHADLFSPARESKQDRSQQADLVLFKLSARKIEATVVEVKTRHDLDGLEGLGEEMASQMRLTADIIEERYFGADSRIDGVLQRSLLAHALLFYVERSRRFHLIDDAQAALLRRHVGQLERETVELTVNRRGYVIPLGQTPKQQRLTIDGAVSGEESVISVIALPRSNADARPAAKPQQQPLAMETAADEAEPSAEPMLGIPDNAASRPDEPTAPPEAQPDQAPRLDETTAETPSDAAASDVAIAAVETSARETDVMLGVNDAGNPVVWKPRVSGAPHAFILGIPGQGKSVTVERILIELAKSNTPALVLDFHGTFADPNGTYARIAKPATLDAARGLPFSPFDVTPGSSWMEIQLHAKGIAEVIDHVFTLGDIQRDVVYTAIRDLYRRRGFDRLDDGEETPPPPTFQEVQKELAKRSKDAGVKNVIARTRSLFEFDLFKPPVDGAPTFDALLKRGLVVGLHRLGGEELALALSAFLLRTVYLNMPSWEIADRIRLVIVLDEAHKLARDVTLPKLMKEGRKYGIAIVAASQGLADFHPDVLGNVGAKIAFRINHPDSKKVADFFQGRPSQNLVSLVEGLGVGQALTQTSEMPFAQRVKMLKADA